MSLADHAAAIITSLIGATALFLLLFGQRISNRINQGDQS